jgi:4'-phosphopantetheinyl transferase
MHERGIDPDQSKAPDVAQSAVDVWRVDLRKVGREPLRLLSAAERERAARFGNPASRALWMRGRGMLRVLLGEYLGRGGDELELVSGRYGKPALGGVQAGPAAPGSESLVHFNLSHSGPLALYAFTAAAPVGVDVELVREHARGERARDEVALAERAFGAQAARRLRELDPAMRRREFLRLWVRHEAALKCQGTGLAGPAGSARCDSLWIADLDLGADATAALCVQSGPRELCLRDWPAAQPV